MKNNLFFSRLLQTAFLVILRTAMTLPALAQAPPGWAWAKAFGGSTVTSNEASVARSVGTDAAGNVYVLGQFVGTTDFGAGNTVSSAGETDVFLAKYAASGAVVWVRVLSGTGADKAGQLAVSAAGRCVMSGTYGELSGGDLNLPGGQVLVGPQRAGAPVFLNNYNDFPFVASFDAQGRKEWAMPLGNNYYVNPYAVCLSATGTAYVSGTSRNALVVNGIASTPIGASDAFLASISPLGTTQWIRRAGMAGAWSGGDLPVLDGAGNLYWGVASDTPGLLQTGGQSYPISAPGGGSILLKIAPQNRVVWGRSVLLPAVSSGPAVFGTLVGFDPANAMLWFKAEATAGITLNFGGILPALTVPAGNGRAVIVGSIDTSGTVRSAAVWATSIGSATQAFPPYSPTIQQIFSGPGRATTVVGQANSDFVLASEGRTYTGRAGSLFVSRLNTTAVLDNWTRFAAVNTSFANYYSNVTGAALDGQGNVYVTGTFPTRAQFGTLAPLLPARGGNWPDGFVAKLDMATITATRTGVQGLAWTAYPNPATGQVRLAGLPPLAQVRLLDAQGRLVRTVQTPVLTGTECSLSLTGLATGLYTLQVSGTAQVFRAVRLTVE